MAGHEQLNKGGREQDDQQPMSNEEVEAAQNVNTQPADEDLDKVLDEIDGVLEENAEVFVRDFVQKGGQ